MGGADDFFGGDVVGVGAGSDDGNIVTEGTIAVGVGFSENGDGGGAVSRCGVGGAGIGGDVELGVGDEIEGAFEIELTDEVGDAFGVDRIIARTADCGDLMSLGDEFFGDLVPAVLGELFVRVPGAGLDNDLVVGDFMHGGHEGFGGELAFVP